MRLDHPIFRGPLDPALTLDGAPWPEAGDDAPTWVVQTGELGRSKQNDYGIVSDGRGFEDSPDCERISGGVNSKGPLAIAIGRQANMLQWGFYCAPDRMTESAQKVFLNAIVWMRGFDGHRPLVKKAARSRGWLGQYAASYAGLSDENRAGSYGDYLRGMFPAELQQRDDVAAAYRDWFAANEEYVWQNGDRLEVDADLAALRVSNRRIEFFEVVAARFAADPADVVGTRLLARYAPEVDANAAAITEFVTDNRDALFFSDVGGYRWFLAPQGVQRAGD